MTTSLATAQVTDQQLSRYADLVYSKTGIRISPQKKALVSNRLRRRLRENGMTCFDAYFALLKSLPANSAEWDAFLQEITTHETYMFRDPTHWKWFQESYLPGVVRGEFVVGQAKTLRIWSAACSTGEEVYTIACCIADCSALSNWTVQILGTDIGVGALKHAQEAVYGERAVHLVPDSFRKRFFLANTKANTWTVRPQLTAMAQFRQHNLLEPMQSGPFDIVLLKNVLIYFDTDSKQIVMKQLKNAIRPGGLLLNGPAEGVSGLLGGWKRLQPWLHANVTP
jgi:chemotaxis protein methyltransferase CheR